MKAHQNKCIYVVMALGLLCFIACDPVDSRLKILNNSDCNIYYTLCDSKDSLKNANYTSVYELHPNQHGSMDTFYTRRIEIHSLDSVPIIGSWIGKINGSKNKRLSLFIIPEDTLKKYPWDYLSENNIYAKNYYLSVEELETMNWTIEYP